MDCPKCKKEMERGYVSLVTDGASGLFFSEEKISRFSVYNVRESSKKMESILYNSLVLGFENNWMREGYKCQNCNIVVIDRNKDDSLFRDPRKETDNEFRTF